MCMCGRQDSFKMGATSIQMTCKASVSVTGVCMVNVQMWYSKSKKILNIYIRNSLYCMRNLAEVSDCTDLGISISWCDIWYTIQLPNLRNSKNIHRLDKVLP